MKGVRVRVTKVTRELEQEITQSQPTPKTLRPHNPVRL